MIILTVYSENYIYKIKHDYVEQITNSSRFHSFIHISHTLTFYLAIHDHIVAFRTNTCKHMSLFNS